MDRARHEEKEDTEPLSIKITTMVYIYIINLEKRIFARTFKGASLRFDWREAISLGNGTKIGEKGEEGEGSRV